MTVAAGTPGIGKVARKRDQPVVCIELRDCLIIAGMARDTICCSECMCRTKSGLFRRMTLQTGVRRRLACLGAMTGLPLQRENYE
jgi:hypothetical protein